MNTNRMYTLLYTVYLTRLSYYWFALVRKFYRMLPARLSGLGKLYRFYWKTTSFSHVFSLNGFPLFVN
jgi:hypothetical protein